MGFLSFVENPLSLEEVDQIKRQLKKDGIIQFLNLYKKFHNIDYSDSDLLFGYEIEAHILKMSPKPIGLEKKDSYAQGIYQLDCNIGELKQKTNGFNFVDEYGAWMLEAIPEKPLSSFINGCGTYSSLKKLKDTFKNILGKNNEVLLSSVYPKMATDSYKYQFAGQKYQEGKSNKITLSKYQDDAIINPHQRFTALSQNVRERRGENPNIIYPLYKDINTEMGKPLYNEPYPGKIHMDAFSHGMGQNCLQITFASSNIDKARWMYDQFSVISPMMMALSAASPIYKGKLSDLDTRWNVIENSTDDRTERMRKEGAVSKGRFSHINFYISNDVRNKDKYNNVKFTYNKAIRMFMKKQAKEKGLSIDNKLLDHYAYLFVRDPLVVYPSRIKVNNEQLTDHFENIQSTNWNNVRFKPPPDFDSNIGWRVEFRVLDSQLTPERNFLFIHAIQLFSRMIADETFGLNFYIPMDKAHENFERSHQRNAALSQRFWFRKNIMSYMGDSDELVELTLAEWFNGNAEFVGMNNIMAMYIDHVSEKIKQIAIQSCCSFPTCQAFSTFRFLTAIADGTILTIATDIRNWVKKNPLYNHDSVLS